LIQVATQVFPFFEMPTWGIRLVVILITAGFPVALVIAWAFELTPEGIKRTEDIPLAAGEMRASSHTWMYVALVAALLSLGLFLLGRYTARNTEARPEITSAKSIAVLPFENLSEEKANAYFADGIHDEIITRLANVGDLKVISRSSTERYKTKPEDLSEIARQLGVAHFLEGSVQKSGDRVRINVQLVRAGTNDHLWAQIFDRQLTDIFAVESEVATAITGALQAKLTGRERAAVEQKPTNNLDAYDVYLKGLDLFTRPSGGSQVQMAADFLKEAVRLDPNFALAWAKLAEVNAAIYFKQFDTTPARKEAARVAAETATKLRSDAPATVLANAFYRYHVLRDYEGARLLFEKVRQEMPNNRDAVRALALVARMEGRWSDALRLFEQAAQLNPRDADLLSEWSWTLGITRQLPAAIQLIDRALSIRPDDPELLANKATIYQTEGNLPAAAAVLTKVGSASWPEPVLFARISQFLFERKYGDAIQLIEKTLAAAGPKPVFTLSLARLSLAQAQDLSGDKTAAKATYAKARDELENFLREQPNNVYISAGLANAYAGLGDKEAALREGERSLAMLPPTEDPVMAPGIEEFFARTEAQVGEIDRAVARLERLLTIPYGPGPVTQALLRLDPSWNPLRSHPRFQKLISGPEPKTTYR
jgi:TolB-like protein/Tfp pilus assembly protein PilF